MNTARSLRLLTIVVMLCAAQITVAQAQAPAPAAATQQASLKPEELEALVAPIALYPDNLLSQVLIASTYPLEVVMVDRWAKANKNLTGSARKAEVDKQTWDDSLKALAAVPETLDMMSGQLDWTTKLGDAVLAQQADVMDAIQRLRNKADANNKLTTTKQQKVTKQKQANKEVIVIEATDPNTLYVPYYDLAVVYGAWPYPQYPAYYWPAPGYLAGAVATGLVWGAGIAMGAWAIGGGWWGGSVNWGNNNININNNIDINRNRNWSHNVEHRHGVRYNNDQVRQKFAKGEVGTRDQRMDFRGRDGQPVLKPDGRPGDRPGAGDRPGGGDRPAAGQRPADRPGDAKQRPGGDAKQRPAGDAKQRPGGDAKQRPGGDAKQRPAGGQGGGQRPGGGGGGAFADIDRGNASKINSNRGHASLGDLGGRGGGGHVGGGHVGGGGRPGGGHIGGGGGGPRVSASGGGRGGGGGGRGGGGGGGRRSDVTLKHDITLLGYLPNGLGYYRFSYVGSNRAYVGVMAQEVETVMPQAVVRDRDGSLRVLYEKLGARFQTYEEWIAKGAQVPAAIRASH